MLDFATELELLDSGFSLIGAFDEAGRGPLAGPVVAACVIASKDTAGKIARLSGVRDSKKLTGKKREALFEPIHEVFEAVGIGICGHETIDRINILEASFLAMKKAMGTLKAKPDYIILDGKFPIPNVSIGQKPIIKGDDKVFSIAAASIIAKVARDRIMAEIDTEYPQYEFARHKGYGTKRHFELLVKYGPCPVHRKSFAPVAGMLA